LNLEGMAVGRAVGPEGAAQVEPLGVVGGLNEADCSHGIEEAVEEKRAQTVRCAGNTIARQGAGATTEVT